VEERARGMSAAAIARCVREQDLAVSDAARVGNPISHPMVQLGIYDWLTEEALILLEDAPRA
jgi:hypothetical protein